MGLRTRALRSEREVGRGPRGECKCYTSPASRLPGPSLGHADCKEATRPCAPLEGERKPKEA
eukprot:2312423-Alexandrium_andersonii.AAC.1